MTLRDWAFFLGGASAAALVYGTLVESKRLVVERYTLALPNWPARLQGYRIALLGDLHLRDSYSVELCRRAVAAALDAEPDIAVLVGDFVGYWKDSSAAMLGEVLEPFLLMNGDAVAVPGNHDYWSGNPSLLEPILEELNIKLLRNQSWQHHGISWIGIDSASAGKHNAYRAFSDVAEQSTQIVLWHEPDPADELPFRANLQLSGHSHGGQWRFPPGWAPMHTRHGEKYVRGFYPRSAGGTPVFVTKGVGTTGPPARMLCPPDVSILEIVDGPFPRVLSHRTVPV